ncbi:MAG TPA: hypothetical protein VHR18_07295 [Solirubrobacterales bacterium]|jgi:hypothetical protein|nr:hypothetical protein [Solirubrobacterales bacterium]
MRRNRAALAIACVALFVALSGSVYAGTKIDGHQVRTGSLPGNRLVPGSLPGNRLRPGTVAADRLAAGSITGAQVDAATLGQVPSATHAESADSARQAATARHATSSAEAERLNGYSAGCAAGTRQFAGACWQLQSSATALTAPEAAAACAEVGGELPAALALAAFAQEPGVVLAVGDEWSGDISNFSGLDKYGVLTVSSEGKVDLSVSTLTKKFRCVIPLVS